MSATLTAQNNNGIERSRALYHLINNVLEYVMTKSIVADSTRIKVNNASTSNRKSIYGVGINDANYAVRPRIDGKPIICPFYKAWHSMMTRCYSEKLKRERPTYTRCAVAPEWHSFMSFRSWMDKQDWKGNQLDKDILKVGNKTYSPETCVFVSQNINTLLGDSLARRGKYPQGVSWNKNIKKFVAQISADGEKKHVGNFDDVKSAHTVARKAKAEHITNIAQTQPELIKSALLHHARLFLDGM